MSRVFPSNVCFGISPEIREEQRRRPVRGGGGAVGFSVGGAGCYTGGVE